MEGMDCFKLASNKTWSQSYYIGSDEIFHWEGGGRNPANIKEVREEIPGENHKEVKNGYQKGRSGYKHILRCTFITTSIIFYLFEITTGKLKNNFG